MAGSGNVGEVQEESFPSIVKDEVEDFVEIEQAQTVDIVYVGEYMGEVATSEDELDDEQERRRGSQYEWDPFAPNVSISEELQASISLDAEDTEAPHAEEGLLFISDTDGQLIANDRDTPLLVSTGRHRFSESSEDSDEGGDFGDDNDVEDALIIPDAHEMFVLNEDRERDRSPHERNDMNEHERSECSQRQARGPLRGGGRIRQPLHRRGGTAAAYMSRASDGQWRRGDKFVQVYMTDDDVPDDLARMVSGAVKQRKERAVRQQAREAMRRQGEEENEDAAEEGVALFAGDELAQCFEWYPMETFQGGRETFLVQQTGSVNAPKSAYEAFRQYWDDSILSHIVTETNRYAVSIGASSESFARTWYDTNVHEILLLFSFWMMLGIIRMPTIKSCFCQNHLLKVNIFSTIFTQKRYLDLSRAINFTDNSLRTPDSNKLFLLGPILDHLNQKFQQAYIPAQNICIDESLILWKGQLSFRQFIKTKAARFGIKTFELCESATGYIWSFFVYTGKQGNQRRVGMLKSTETVLRLIHPLLEKGYTLYMDNWFNSPILARYLKRHRTDCVGTLRLSRREVPPLVNLIQLQEGQYLARHSGDITIMALQDKKKIATISTCHGAELCLTGVKRYRPPQWKPQVIVDYNKGMGGVDRKDQMLEPYLLERKKHNKWYMKLFKRLLNYSIHNSFVTFYSSKDNSTRNHLEYRLSLVDEILNHHLSHAPQSRRPRHPLVPRYTGHHPESLPKNGKSGKEARSLRRSCVHCKQRGIRSATIYICSACKVPLCLNPCFKLHHTEK